MDSDLRWNVSTGTPSLSTEPSGISTELLDVSTVPLGSSNTTLNASTEVGTVSNEDFNISTEALAMDTEAGPISTEALGLSSPASLLPDQLITDDTYNTVMLVFYCGIMPSIAIIGFVGNAAAISILLRTRRQMKLSVYTYITALTIADTVYLANIVLRVLPVALDQFNVRHGSEVLAYFQYYSSVANRILMTWSVYILILLSVERLIAIWKPLRVNQTLMARYPICYVTCALVVVTILIIPAAAAIEIKGTDSNKASVNAIVLRDSMKVFFDRYVMFISLCCNYLPFFLFLALNIAIVVQYRRVLERRRRTFNDVQIMSRRDTKLVATVLHIMTVYTICKILDIVSSTLYAVDDDFKMEGKYNKVTSILLDISDLFIVINGASDFIIYILMSSKYKELFIGQFCLCCKTNSEVPP